MNQKIKRLFTLIELLIVMVILVVLVALLLPALIMAREQAKIVACMNNHRQCLVGATAYADDGEGRLPNTDGSWICRHKNGVATAQSLGLLWREGYLGAKDRQSIKIMFCYSAFWNHNWRWPGHMYNNLAGSAWSTNQWAMSTIAGKFCTFIGYNTPTHPTQADLFLGRGGKGHDAAYISPILTVDMIMNGGNPYDPTPAGSWQGHRRGVVAGFYDGAVRFFQYGEIYEVQPQYGRWNTINPYGNVYHWARAEFGLK